METSELEKVYHLHKIRLTFFFLIFKKAEKFLHHSPNVIKNYQELSLDLLCRWQSPSYWSHYLLLLRLGINRKLVQEQSWAACAVAAVKCFIGLSCSL